MPCINIAIHYHNQLMRMVAMLSRISANLPAVRCRKEAPLCVRAEPPSARQPTVLAGLLLRLRPPAEGGLAAAAVC